MDNQIREVLSNIISYAESDKHLQFKLLASWPEYKQLRIRRAGVKKVIKLLNAITRRMFKNYCKTVVTRNQKVNKLLAHNQLLSTLDFYKQELTVINDILDEYEIYLISGNWLDMLFLSRRPEDKMWDHRR